MTNRSLLLVLGGLLVAAPSADAAIYFHNVGASEAEECPAPPSPSGATASGTIIMDTNANTISYDITYTGLSGSFLAAHIHGFAGACPATAGIKITLASAGAGHLAGTASYPEVDEASYLAGMSYVNIHSSNNGGGQIRDQFRPTLATVYQHTVTATEAEECPAPPSPSGASATGTIRIDTSTNTISYDISYTNLSGSFLAAHIHGFSGNCPATAGIKITLTSTGPGRLEGSATYPEGDEPSYLGGQTYLNIHSSNNGGGQVRDQIAPIVVGVGDGPRIEQAGIVAISPNPSHRRARIDYSIPVASRVQLDEFDLAGRRVAFLEDRFLVAGRHSADWDTRGALPSGVYLVRLQTAEGVDVERAVRIAP